MKKKLIYVSHSIRGKYGNDATPEQMKVNNDRAIEFGNKLRRQFPGIDFYVPGEMDGFLLRQGVHAIDIVEALLGLDCAIISVSDGVLFYMPDDYISGGMKREEVHAQYVRKSIFYYGSCQCAEQTIINVVNWLEGIK